MLTKLDIFNRALAAVLHEQFLSSEDSTFPEGVACRREWDPARRAVLNSHEWGWLVEQTPYCVPGTNAGRIVIPRPNDVLRVLGVVDREGRHLRAISRNGMFYVERTDATCAALRYIPDNEDPEDWPHHIQEAVIAGLAYRLSISFKRSVEISQITGAEAVRTLTHAKKLDSDESRSSGSKGDKYVKARL